MNKNQSSWPRIDSYNRISSWPAPLQPPTTQKWPARPNTYNEAEQLLREAVGYWDASLYRDGDRFLRNQGTAGDLLDLRLGSSIIPNTNDPLYLAPEDIGYSYLPGVTGNFLSVPDENALDITGDIDLRIQFMPGTGFWSTFSNASITKQGSYSFNHSYSTINGQLSLSWRENGAGKGQSSTVSVSANLGSTASRGWIRATLDVDNGAGGHDVKFYTSLDGNTWTQLGSTITTAGTTSIDMSTNQCRIGDLTGFSAAVATANIYRAQILNGIDGTTVLDIDCNAITDGSATQFSAGTGQIVSINRSSTGRKSVAMPAKKYGTKSCFLLGTDDYFIIPAENNQQHNLTNFNRSDSFTIIALARDFGTDAAPHYIISKMDSSGNGWNTHRYGVNQYVQSRDSAGLTQSNKEYPTGSTGTFCFQRETEGRARVWPSVNGSEGTKVVELPSKNLVTSFPLYAGRASTGGYFDGEISSAAVFRRSLTQREVQLIVNYYQNPQYFYAPSKEDQKTYLSNQLNIDPVSGSAVLDVLADATFYIDSRKAVSGERYAKNLGLRGDALNVRYGSSQVANSNDPLLLTPESTGYAYLSTSVDNYLSVPNSISINPSGSVEIIVRVKDLSAVIDQRFYDNLSGTYGLIFRQVDYGQLQFYWFHTDGTVRSINSSYGLGTFSGWIRGVLTPDDGSGNRVASFYTANDSDTEPASWTQLGTTVSAVGAVSIAWGTQSHKIGKTLTGKIYRVLMKDGINGTKVLDIDCNAITSGSQTSFLATTGQVVTVNRSTSGRKTALIPNTTVKEWDQGHVYLPGVANNYASTPDASALDITGDIDIRVRVALDDWTPTSAGYFIMKYAGGARAYGLYINTNGTLRLYWSADGSTVISRDSTISTGIADGSIKWIRAVLDINNDTSGHDVKFYISDNGSVWTQLGSTITTAGITSIAATTSPIAIGANTSGGEVVAGRVYRVQVLNGINGTTVLDIDFNDANSSFVAGSPSSFVCSTGQTVTLNSTANSGMVVRDARSAAGTPVWLFGTDDYMEIDSPLQHDWLNFSSGKEFSIMAIVRNWSLAGGGTVMAKTNSVGTGIVGWGMTQSTTAYRPIVVGNGTRSFVLSNPIIAGNIHSIVGSMSGDRTITPYLDGYQSTTTSNTSVGSQNVNMLIGNLNTAMDMELVAAAVFRRALTITEIKTLSKYFDGLS